MLTSVTTVVLSMVKVCKIFLLFVSRKHVSPIDLTEAGSTTFVSPVFWNAKFPRLVMKLGISISVKLPQNLNASFGMVVFRVK